MGFMNVGSDGFNISHILHAVWALAISLVAIGLAYIVPAIYLLCFAGTLFFFAREHAHTELKLKDKEQGITLAVTLKALMFWKWDIDTLLDFLSALVVSILLCLLIS